MSNMMEHFSTHNILKDCQHGFRSNRSCESQLISLTQELHEHLEDKEQVDMIVLDFSKAFDKVGHKRLLKKLHNYGIRGNLLRWVLFFLLDRKQRVVVDGEHSEWVKMESGVPQGTVLGPIMFLAFINDLPDAVSSKVRLFADDCVMYRTVKDDNDCNTLQEDLNKLAEWEKKWLMSFNPSKCSTISITRKKKRITHDYSLHDQVLERTEDATYLGVQLNSQLTWTNHINRTCSKANRNLAFLKRNLPIKSQHVKVAAYKGIVRPVTEYCSPVWSPHQKKDIDQLETVQCRAARYVFHNYQRKGSSVSGMIKELGWESLQQRRARADMVNFYKVQHGLIAVQHPHILQRIQRPKLETTNNFQKPFCSTYSYKFSFFPRSMRMWNKLDSSISSLDSLTSFKAAISKLPL